MSININRILVAGVLGALWSGASAEGRLTGLSYQRVGQGVQIQAQGINLPTPKLLRLNANRSYMLEFRDTLLDGGFKRIRVHYGGVQYATAGWFSSRPPVVRVHVWLSPKAKPILSQSGPTWVVSVNAPAPPAEKPSSSVEAEPFPARVPPLEKALAPTAKRAEPAVKVYEESGQPAMRAVAASKPPASVNPHRPTYVTLDFSGTEVVQIIKALAMQSGVNIIAGPEVQGKINVTLKRVELTEALDYVTTLAGLRYAKVGKTYVVTSSARFAEAMQQLAGKLEDAGETRVVQLTSGEGTQIKAAVFKALPQFTSKGSYDVILPTESIRVSSSTGLGQTQGAGAASGSGTKSENKGQGGASGQPGGEGKQDSQGAAAAAQTFGTSETMASGVALEAKSQPTDKGAKDAYLVVVGSPERVNEVIAFIKKLDRELAQAANVGPNRDIATRVVPIYSGHVERITEAMQAIIDRDARKPAFKICNNVSVDKTTTVAAAGAAETVEQKKMPRNPLVFLTGPKDALDGLVDIANTLDKGICDALGMPYAKDLKAQRYYEVIGLNYIDPDQALFLLNSHIPRLSADYMPGGVGTTKAAQSKSSSDKGNASPQAGGAASPASPDQPGAAASGGGATVNKMDIDIDSTPMQILAYGTAEEIEAAKKLLATVDRPAKQVALELRVMELSKEDALKVGLDWSLFTGGTLKSIRINNGLSAGQGTVGSIGAGSTTDILDKSGAPTVTPGLDLGGGDTLNILGKLDQLNDSNKLISRPNILATDGRRTRIFIGDTVRYVESIQSSQNGVTVTTRELPVGVEMKLLARVGTDNSINLDLTPSFTLLKGFTTVPGGGSLPQTSTREANTLMTIKDGDTIAIGGLIQDQDIKSVGGVPLLRDIPLLGELFKRTEKNKIRKEVVFFLTAKVVDNSNKGYAAHPKANDNLNLPEPPKAN